MSELLDHLLDPLTLLQSKVHGVLRDGGIVVAEVSNCAYFKHRWTLLWGRLPHFGEDQQGAGQRPYNLQHKTLFTRQGLIETFEHAGFRVIQIEPEVWSPRPLLQRLGIAGICSRVIALARRMWPELLAVGFILKAKKR